MKKAKEHSVRPKNLRKGNSWQCKCREFNKWENEKCWSKVEEDLAAEQSIYKRLTKSDLDEIL